MTTSPNQRIFTIRRDMPKQSKDNKRPYMVAYNDVIEEAGRNLSTVGAFKVYMYCISNQDNYRFGCSPQDIADKYGISLKTAKDGIDKLIENGYLISTGKNTYEFHERPVEIGLEPVEEVRKKFRTKKGNVIELTYAELVDRVGQDKANIAWTNAQ